jgi:hypothetical protein
VLQEKKIRVLNLGYCRLGRNLNYALLKELLLIKKPRLVILEVTETENRYGHPIFPYIAEQKDVLLPALLFNRDILKDAYTMLAFKTELIQEQLISGKQLPPIDLNPYGFSGHEDTAATKLLNDFFIKRHQPDRQSNFEHWFYNAYPKSYLEKTVQLCKEQNIKLCFLYLPAFGTSLKAPSEMKLYEAYGTVLIPPTSIFENKFNWFDENHFNTNGSSAISKWIGEELKRWSLENSKGF